MRSFLDGPRETTLSHVLRRELDIGTTQLHPVSLAFLDVDDLTGFNQRHSWSAGTALLGSIADVLVALGPEVLAGSFGGDEFAAVLSGTNRRQARARMHQALNRITSIEIHGVTQGERPHVSVGGATSHPGCTFAELIRCAHDALVSSKSAGGGRVTWARNFAADPQSWERRY
jgi:diguanylate cyclase (GGDEF)-like protein